LRNPGLARTDEPIARLGAKNFYRGLDVYSMGPTGRRLHLYLEASRFSPPL
jgi:hypothetical protein